MLTQQVRARGVRAVRADAATVLAQLQPAFEDFKKRHASELDAVNASIAALKVGGIGSEGEPVNAGVQRARAELGEFARSGQVNAAARPMASMSTDDNPSGGYLVQPELEKQITRYQRDLSPMRRLARVVATKSGDYQIPIATGGADAGWVGEKSARPETDGPPLALNTITAHEIYANPSVTQKLLDDAVEDIGAYLAEEIGQAFDGKEGDAFVNGDGINKPRGFLTVTQTDEADGVRAYGSLQYLETAGSGTVAVDDLIGLLYTLRAGYRSGATWLMSSATAGVIRKLKDADGNHIWSPATEPGITARMLGYPVAIDEGMPTIAAGNCPVAFGNFRRGYVIVDRMGVRLLRDALTNKPFVQFYTTKRVGGSVHDTNAIKLLKVKA